MSTRRQARVEAAAVALRYDKRLPPEFAIGRCVEVWAATDGDAISAFSRYGQALRVYAAEMDATRGELTGNKSPGAPYSVDYLIEHGHADIAAARFAAAGVTFNDIRALRRAAKARRTA